MGSEHGFKIQLKFYDDHPTMLSPNLTRHGGRSVGIDVLDHKVRQER